MGDKTQLLALLLASRFKKPWAIMAGILVATLANHALAAWAGGWLATLVTPETLRYILAGVFFLFAGWLLLPDKSDGLSDEKARFGAFITTTIAFFIAEMGDKTQLATVALGAKFDAPVAVTLGTTVGMLAANGIGVFMGEKLTRRVPMAWINRGAAVLFALFGAAILLGY
jgi:putative Ca2+/H+ antiporter (TMEM165/GDT1 family)